MKKTKKWLYGVIICIILVVICIGLVILLNSKKFKYNTFSFTEEVATIQNPGVGYTQTDWYHTAPGNTLVHEKQGSIVLFFIDISRFSSGSNGTTDENGNYIEGIDYDLDQAFFDALRATFENCQKNGSTIALRFRYDENGKSYPEPKTFDKVLGHISQIKESGILEEYKDILMFVESGFVGAWGEQHSGKYTSVEYKAKLLDAMLDCVPDPIPVTVRTPDTFAKWAGIERSQLNEYIPLPGSKASRVGLYNDGYMGSNSDLGTYHNREVEVSWLGKQTLTSYFGGEFSGNLKYAEQFETYLPQNAIPEMYKTHLSYINGNIFQKYKEFTFDKNYDVEGYNNSAYYGQSVFQFIRDHLGYRFVLKNSKISKKVKQGGKFDISFTLVNNGFANPIKKQKCEIILEKQGEFICTNVDLDPTKWYSGSTQTVNLSLKIPGFIKDGKWNVYFKSSIGNKNMQQFAYRSIRFANKNTYNENLGANYLGFINVKKSSKNNNITDNTFYQIGIVPAIPQLFNYNSKITVDGIKSFDKEWENVIADNGTNKIYAKVSDEDLYLMSNIAHNSVAPVFNVRITEKSTNTTYWIYIMSNGFIYFNHESETGHIGLEMKYSKDMFEFKIPLYMLNLTENSIISHISMFVQDSSNGWKGTGSIETNNEYVVHKELFVINSYEELKVKENSNLLLQVHIYGEIVNIVWEFNDKVISGQTSPTLELKNIKGENVGVYSAIVTTASGITKEIKIAHIQIL